MSKRDDGGPAFPLNVAIDPSGDIYNSGSVPDGRGMTLRDWFAGQALVALASVAASLPHDDTEESFSTWLAAGCYEVADAMLAERAKETP